MRTKNSGFTLIELMITLAVVAIITTIAVPAMRSMIQNNRIATQTNLLVTLINLSRSEAVKRGSPVSACVSSDQATCSGATNWANGWIVFDDLDNSGSLDAGETVIRVRTALKGGATVTGPAFITYSGTGFINAPTSLALTIPGCTGNQKRTITLSATGRPTVTTASC